MLMHGKLRMLSTLLGIAVAFFLSSSQVGLLVGWCNTCSAIIRHAGADVWVMAEQTPAFDYGTPIPGQRIYQVRSVPGVACAEGLIMSWMFWQVPDGRQQNVEMVGLDESLIGGPWKMQRGDVDVVYEPDSFIIDALYCERLGITALDQEIEVQGQRAVVRGVSESVRTLTAAPFVFTSLDTARRYDPRYRAEEVTYVVAKCEPGHSPIELRDQIAATVSSGDVLTTAEFATRTIQYWMLETGLGITVVLTAILGLAVSTVIISQTLFAITNDHLRDYATLLAIGFSRRQMLRVVLFQAGILGVVGISLGTVLFVLAMRASAQTPIPIETTPAVFAGIVVISLACCGLASLLSIRALFRIDPVQVFHA